MIKPLLAVAAILSAGILPAEASDSLIYQKCKEVEEMATLAMEMRLSDMPLSEALEPLIDDPVAVDQILEAYRYDSVFVLTDEHLKELAKEHGVRQAVLCWGEPL